MPTLSSGPANSPAPQPHQLRRVAESFGTDAERYDRTRPTYPDAMIRRIIATSPGRDVVDVGCGTGIAARLFQAAGCAVLGVEPDERMADWARTHGTDIEISTFEDWDPAGRLFDTVVAGQTWHWVDPVAGAAKAAQALRPGGRLAVFWNSGQPPGEVGQAFAAVYREMLPDLSIDTALTNPHDAYAAMATKAADGLRETGAFDAVDLWRFDWEHTYTRDEWLDQVPTQGGFSLFPPDTQSRLLAGVAAAIDAAGGSFTMGYATLVTIATRTVTDRAA
ncbi:class I SAM-dependent methyltransferase [Nocardia sp. NPDC052566]|uniref:class I SAM-dependent methyltransferase n=1 Tax=Nocardia sp. NPDC052566 TaxID=3364330 RepID=UPI0037C67D21